MSFLSIDGMFVLFYNISRLLANITILRIIYLMRSIQKKRKMSAFLLMLAIQTLSLSLAFRYDRHGSLIAPDTYNYGIDEAWKLWHYGHHIAH